MDELIELKKLKAQIEDLEEKIKEKYKDDIEKEFRIDNLKVYHVTFECERHFSSSTSGTIYDFHNDLKRCMAENSMMTDGNFGNGYSLYSINRKKVFNFIDDLISLINSYERTWRLSDIKVQESSKKLEELEVDN